MQDNASAESRHGTQARSPRSRGSPPSSPDGSPVSSVSNSRSMDAASSADAVVAAAAATAQASSLLTKEAGNPTPPKKTRSQSPGAVQRRRMQNRIAQRNHRQKVRERQAEERERWAREQAAQDNVVLQAHLYSSRSSTASVCSSNSSSLSNYPGQFLHQMPPSASARPPPPPPPGAAMLGLGSESGFDKGGWMADPTLLPTPDSDVAGFPGGEYLDMPCACNSLTGPCVQHCHEVRGQFLGFLSSAVSHQNGMGGGGDGVKSIFSDGLQQQHHHHHHQADSLYSDMHQQPQHYQHTPTTPFGQQRPPPPPSTTATTISTSTTSSSTGSVSPCLGPEPRPSSPHPNSARNNNIDNNNNNNSNNSSNDDSNTNNHNTPTPTPTRSPATNTSRFKTILTFVRAAGFPDFDAMVASYYTADFTRNSVADLAQRSSRGRRLGGVLAALRASAERWTVWESRQYREGVAQAAQGLYARELEAVLRRARKTQQRREQEEEQQQAHRTYMSPPLEQLDQKQQQQQQQQDTTIFGSEAFSEAATSSAAAFNSLLSGLAMPEEMGRVFQDNLPNLWALLTELAGAQGLQCDRVALQALLLLYSARQNPEVDADELVPDWLAGGGAPSSPSGAASALPAHLQEPWWGQEKQEQRPCQLSNLGSAKASSMSG